MSLRNKLPYINDRVLVKGKMYNDLVDRINAITIQSTQNIRRVETSSGVHLIGQGKTELGNVKLWRMRSFTTVDDDGAANNYEAYYNCAPMVIGYSADSGTTTATTSNKLVDSTQNFNTTVDVGTTVFNTIDPDSITTAKVTAVDSDTTLAIDSDIMTSGDTYIVRPLFNDSDARVTGGDGTTEIVYNMVAGGVDTNDAVLEDDILIGTSYVDYAGIKRNVAVPINAHPRVCSVVSTQTDMLGGYYKCRFKQEQDFNTIHTGPFGTFSPLGKADVQVLHLGESGNDTGETRQLVVDDLMLCWRTKIGTGVLPDYWVGIQFFVGTQADKDVAGVTTGTLAQLQTVVRNILTVLEAHNFIVDSTT